MVIYFAVIYDIENRMIGNKENTCQICINLAGVFVAFREITYFVRNIKFCFLILRSIVLIMTPVNNFVLILLFDPIRRNSTIRNGKKVASIRVYSMGIPCYYSGSVTDSDYSMLNFTSRKQAVRKLWLKDFDVIEL